MVELGRGSLAPEDVAARSMAALQGAISWDGYRLFGVDSQTLLINRLLAASDNDGWARREWLEEVYLVDDTVPYIQLPTILRSGLKGVAYQDRQEQSWGFPAPLLESVSADEHRRYFHESRSPSGGVLLAGFASNGRWIAALQAYRREPGAAFRPGDVEFLSRSGSLVGAALWASLERERRNAHAATSISGAPSSSGVVVLESTGDLRLATPAAEAWIDLLAAGERSRAGLLPTALWSAMLGLRRQASRSPSHIVRTMTASGMVQLEATPAGADGSVAIVINRPPAAAAPGVPEGWSLTERQKGVAFLMAAGKSNREIAADLYLSENTVEWHIRQIFQRLDVRSRQELTVRYFREAGIGAYVDPDLVNKEK